MKTYYVSVAIKEVHTYEVKANSRDEAYDKLYAANFCEATKPVDLDTEEPIPGVEYEDCMVHNVYVYTDVEEG